MPEPQKIVLFIVEGDSDKRALEKIFKTIYRNDKRINFKFTSGDITSNETVTVENVEDMQTCFMKNSLTRRDCL